MSRFEGIVISGASRGLGAALARSLAGPGVRMLLVARSAEALEKVAAECAARGARQSAAAAGYRCGCGCVDIVNGFFFDTLLLNPLLSLGHEAFERERRKITWC
jgi:NAD(P)-dependent dehydrogenase (short-subunit alcohol dehydrogenase family)